MLSRMYFKRLLTSQNQVRISALTWSPLAKLSTAEPIPNEGNIYQIYKPESKIEFNQDKKYCIFSQDQSYIYEIPYEVKESTVKNLIGVSLCSIFSFLFHPYFSAITLGFVGNYFARIMYLLWNRVTHIYLLDDGKSVELKLKRGGSVIVPIASISKLADEKELMETFSEGFLFPIKVTQGSISVTYRIFGHSFETIHHGGLFRAIINGSPIDLSESF